MCRRQLSCRPGSRALPVAWPLPDPVVRTCQPPLRTSGVTTLVQQPRPRSTAFGGGGHHRCSTVDPRQPDHDESEVAARACMRRRRSRFLAHELVEVLFTVVDLDPTFVSRVGRVLSGPRRAAGGAVAVETGAAGGDPLTQTCARIGEVAQPGQGRRWRRGLVVAAHPVRVQTGQLPHQPSWRCQSGGMMPGGSPKDVLSHVTQASSSRQAVIASSALSVAQLTALGASPNGSKSSTRTSFRGGERDPRCQFPLEVVLRGSQPTPAGKVPATVRLVSCTALDGVVSSGSRCARSCELRTPP